MDDVLTASIFGILTLAFWGTSTWLFSHTSKKNISSLELNLSAQSPSIIIAFILLLSVESPIPAAKNILALFLVSSLYTLGFVSFLKAVSRGATGVVVPLSNIYPLILLFLSIILLKQDFSFNQVAVIFVLVIGVMLTAFEGKKGFQIKRLDSHIELALACAVFFGVANFILNAIVDELSWQILYSYINIFMVVQAISLIWLMQRKQFKTGLVRSFTDKKGLIGGIIVTIGSLFFYFGIDAVSSVVIIVAIASAEPLIASLLSRIIDKEILTPYKRIGAVMIVVAIVLLNIYG